ncbi:phage tail tape measure protein [Martelella limonii]|uniref:phage tail tape measure protein n=1 Tax=Martelella limonii TaxID=1647649 RepID=UPI001580AC32|nr:phage tail tape measure protein [Martelella limonii]
MATDEERLVVMLEARIRDFEKNMRKAGSTADRNYDRMRRSSTTATKRMEADMVRSTATINKALASTTAQIGTFGKAFAGGLVGGLTIAGLTAVVSKVQDVAAGVAEVGYQAKIAGVNVEAFQELKYVADQNRIGVDALTDGLKEMNLRADEFIFSKGKSGSAAEAFKRLGYDAETLAEKLKNPSALFAEIIGRLQQLDKAAQIRIADEIFGGTGGEEFVKLIEDGEAGIRDAIDAAHDLGIVMDEDLIDKAVELDRQFGIVADTVGTALKTAIVEAASALASFIDLFREFENRSTQSLQVKQAQLARERISLENQILETQSNPNMTDQQRRRVLNNLNRQKVVADEKDAEITGILNQRLYPDDGGGTTMLPPITVSTAGGSGRGGRGRGRSSDRDHRSVERMVQALQDELAMLQMTDREKEVYTNLRRAGAAATQAEQATITSLTESLYDQSAAQERAAETAKFFGDIASDSFLAMIPAIQTGNAALDNMINKLIEAAAQAALFGSGPLAGLFGGGAGLLGGLFGLPAHASGTQFAPGGMSLVGERGPELVDLPRGSKVIPNHQLPLVAPGRSSQNVHVTVGVAANSQGSIAPYVESVVAKSEKRTNAAISKNLRGEAARAAHYDSQRQLNRPVTR